MRSPKQFIVNTLSKFSKSSSTTQGQSSGKEPIADNTPSASHLHHVSSPISFVVNSQRRLPYYPLDRTLGTPSGSGASYYKRIDYSFDYPTIDEMYNNYGLLSTPVNEKIKKMFGKGFRIAIPNSDKKDSKHPKETEIAQFVIDFDLMELLKQTKTSRAKFGAGYWLLELDDIKPGVDDFLAKPVNNPKKLLGISTYTKRELLRKERLYGETGPVTAYVFKLKSVDARLGKKTKVKYREVPIHPDRIIENTNNPDGSTPDGIPELLVAMQIALRLRNLGWDMSDIAYNRAAPFPLLYFPSNITDENEIAELRDLVSNLHSKDGMALPRGDNNSESYELNFPKDFSNIADLQPIIEFLMNELAASLGIPLFEIYGGTNNKDTDDGSYINKLHAELNTTYSQLVYKLFNRLQKWNIIKDESEYSIVWRPLFELDAQEEALVHYYEAQRGILLTNTGWEYNYDEMGVIDNNSVRYVGELETQISEPEKPPEEPREYTDVPGSKTVVNKYFIFNPPEIGNPNPRRK